MDLRRTGLEREIAESAHDFVASRCGPAGLRERGEGVFDPRCWDEVAALGWFDLLVPEASGGLGLGAVEAGAVAEAAGAGLLVGPLFGSMVAGALARGRGVDVGPVTTWADLPDGRRAGDRITGTAPLVSHAVEASHLLVRVGPPGEESVVVVEQGAPGLEAGRVLAADPTESVGWLSVSSTPATPVATGGDGAALADELVRWGRLIAASRTVGVLDRLVDLAVGHASTREQFGRPIGAFQALAHLLADLATTTEMARTACYLAQASMASGTPDVDHRVRVAAAFTSRAARSVAEGALQALGGIGFTTEHDLHLYYRHALGLQAAWGDETDHEQALGRALVVDAT